MKRTLPKKKIPTVKESPVASQLEREVGVNARTKNTVLFSFLVLLVLFLHLWRLDSVPPGFYVDESSIGYNAYSVLRTGADEHGVLMPLYFKAFGDYKNPVFIYSLVPLIGIFGLSPWTVRLAAALFGLGAAFFLGLIVKEIDDNKYGWAFGFALAGLTPWLFTLSRIGFEVISFVFLIALAWWSWLKAIKTRSSAWFFITGSAWGLAIFAYSTARLMVPLLVIALVACYFSELKSSKFRWLFGAIPLFLCVFVLVHWSVSNPGSLTARFATISIWSDSNFTGAAIGFLSNYFNYFSPNFLFMSGDHNLRHHAEQGGELFLFTFPALLCGLVHAWQNRNQPLERFTLIAFLLFPIAASLTRDSSHALRAVNGFPFIVLLTIWGFNSLWVLLRPQRMLMVVFLVLGLFECGAFYYDYFFKYPERASAWYNAGLPAAVRTAMEHKTSDLYYSSFAFADERFEINQPYIQFLFFGKLDPAEYQRGGLNAFRIYQYKRGTTVPKGSMVLLKSGQEVFTPSGLAIKMDNPDTLSQEAELIGEFKAAADNSRIAPVFQVFRIL